MSRRKINPKPKHKQIRRERDPLPWKYCFLTVLCGLILLAGFFGAARQHFASIEYGIKNSKLRKEIEELKTENRNLINARETALAPLEIIKAAKKFGFTDKVKTAAPTASNQTKTPLREKESARDILDDKTSPKDNKTKALTEDKGTEKTSKAENKTDKKGKAKPGVEKSKTKTAK